MPQITPQFLQYYGTALKNIMNSFCKDSQNKPELKLQIRIILSYLIEYNNRLLNVLSALNASVTSPILVKEATDALLLTGDLEENAASNPDMLSYYEDVCKNSALKDPLKKYREHLHFKLCTHVPVTAIFIFLFLAILNEIETDKLLRESHTARIEPSLIRNHQELFVGSTLIVMTLLAFLLVRASDLSYNYFSMRFAMWGLNLLKTDPTNFIPSLERSNYEARGKFFPEKSLGEMINAAALKLSINKHN